MPKLVCDKPRRAVIDCYHEPSVNGQSFLYDTVEYREAPIQEVVFSLGGNIIAHYQRHMLYGWHSEDVSEVANA